MDTFDRAIVAYSQHLNAAEFVRIKAPISLSALVAQAQTMGKVSVEDGKKPCILHTLGEKAALLEPFEALLQGFCKSTPVAGDLIWGSVSFILEMLKSDVTAFEKVLVFFQTMADEVGHIRLHEETFASSTLVQSVVESLYKAILDFWVEAVKYYRSRHSGLRRRLKILALSSSIDKKFQALTEAITKQRTRLYEVSSAQHSANSAFFYEESSRHQRNAHRRQLKDWLDAPDYESDFRAANERRYEGTCEWIEKKRAFAEWTSTASTPLLFVHGIPGAGKTVLSSWVVMEARSHATEDELVLYHYFKDTDTIKRSPLSAIRSLIDQLFNYLRYTDHPLLSKLESILDDAFQHSRHVHFSDLWDIFSKSLATPVDPLTRESAIPIRVVLDALDECDSPQTLIIRLVELAQRSRGKVKIFITGRNSAWNLVERCLSTSSYRPLDIRITLDDVQQDIRAFVEYTISNIPRLTKHKSLRDRLSEEIGRVDNHQGMFLWAYFMCEEVKRQGDLRALQRLLDYLPKGLDAMYARICESIIERDETIGLCLSVLQWIANSPRPLQFSELQEGLRWMRSTPDNDTWSQEEWFDSKTDLLWSREDIVDACGNLVTYSGINKGDCFMLVHLSATQFFRKNTTHSHGTIKSFVEDVQTAQPTLGTLCLKYLLSDTLRSDEYFAPSVSVWGVSPLVRSASDSFIHRHPLFDFVVGYWLDLFLASLGSKIPVDLGLLSRVLVFISDPFSSVWLEHFIRKSSVEDVVYTLRKFEEVGIGDRAELTEFMLWAQQVIKVLCTFMQTLSRRPELVRTCCGTASSVPQQQRTWQMIHDNEEAVVIHEFPPLEAASRAWIHYNPDKNMILSAEGRSDAMRLKRRIMTTGVPMRPALVDIPQDQGAGMSFVFHSAAVSPNSSMIAIAFYSSHQNDNLLFVVCWRLSISNVLMSPQTQADVAFYDHVKLTQPFNWASSNHCKTNVSANIIAFRGEDALVTPQGIWDLRKGEWLCGPATIYEHNRALCGTVHVCFSGNGERAARLKSSSDERDDGFDEIEVLNTRDGMTICQVGFPNANKLSLQAFSYLGQKVIVLDDNQGKHDPPYRLRQTYNLCLCILVDHQSFITLDIPYPIQGLEFPQFTVDEDTFVASFSGLCQPKVSASITIWRFAKNQNGRYLGRASMTHLFKSWESNYVFCLIPGLRQSSGTLDAMIITHNGTITRRPIDAVWSAVDERNLGESPTQRFTATEVIPESKIFNIKAFSRADINMTSVVSETWSFQSQPRRLISRVTSTVDIAFSSFRREWLSPCGTYLIGNGWLFHIFQESAGTRALKTQASIRLSLEAKHVFAVIFSTHEHRVAIVHYDKDLSCVFLSVFDIDKGSVQQRFSLDLTSVPGFITGPLSFRLASHSDLTQFAIINRGKRRIHTLLVQMTRTYELLSTELIRGRSTWDYPTNLSFSHCHHYLMLWNDGSLWPVLQPIQTMTKDTRSIGHDAFVHPAVLHLDSCYVHYPYMLTLRRESPHTGSIVLDLKLIGTKLQFHSRNICVLPDKMIAQNLDAVYLVWPSNHESEVSVVAALAGQPDVIETGIKAEDMMKQDMWIQISGNEHDNASDEEDYSEEDSSSEDEDYSEEDSSSEDEDGLNEDDL